MTVREVANATGVPLMTVYNHVRRGDLFAEKRGPHGGQWYILPGEVLSWSAWLWGEGRVKMFPPEYTLRFIRDFDLR